MSTSRNLYEEHTVRLRRISAGTYKMMLLGMVVLTKWRTELDHEMGNLLGLLVTACFVVAIVIDIGRGIRALNPRAE